MKKVLITGKNGSLSTVVAEYLKSKNEYMVEQVSVHGEEWKAHNFSEVDSIIHIAGVTPQNAKSTEDYYSINAELTKELTQKCKNDGVKQFVYISSMAVYGIEQSMDIEKGTITKDTRPAPTTDYGKSKLLAEDYIRSLETNEFRVAVIRVPSIYGKGKTEYTDQYKYLAEKLPVIPRAFENCYKSAICVDNLCELIHLIIADESTGIFCPDDGKISAVDFCSAIYPNRKKSKFLGKLIEIFLKNNARILDYYGAVCYSTDMTDIFDGKYRVKNLEEAIQLSYE